MLIILWLVLQKTEISLQVNWIYAIWWVYQTMAKQNEFSLTLQPTWFCQFKFHYTNNCSQFEGLQIDLFVLKKKKKNLFHLSQMCHNWEPDTERLQFCDTAE